MKRLIILTLMLFFAIFVEAQEVDFVPFENAAFGVTGLLPETWTDNGFGVYTRAENADDLSTIIIQAAPLPVDTLLGALTRQLGVETMPDATRQIEGNLLWDIRQVTVTVQGVEVAISLATSEADSKTYLVLLQSRPDEHDALFETIFVPVVESIAPLFAEVTEVPYLAEEISFASGEINLAGTVTIPEGEGPFPAVVLISGSGAQDRDESLAPIAAIKPFRDIADYLTRNGILVLRYDERGVGESEGDYATATLVDFAADVSAAVDYLASREDVASIGLIGHSEGGLIAPQIANENESVDFVIGLAAPSVNLYDLLLQQNRRLWSLSLEESEVEAIIAELEIAFDALIADDEVALRESVARLVELQTGATADDSIVEQGIASLDSFKSLGYFDYDVETQWAALEQPLLAIYGDLDVQVDSEQNAPALEELVAENEDSTIIIFPQMNHVLQAAETGGLEEYGTLEQSVMPEVLETISAWILERFE